jgi:hypothetical protein
VFDGGHTNVEIGRVSGILFIVMNSWFIISLRFDLYDGSDYKQPLMKSYACSLTFTVSGK